MGRIGRSKMFMQIAEIMSARGTCKRLKVGAILVRHNRVISSGYVGAPPGQDHCLDVGCLTKPPKFKSCKRTIHAEANTIIFASKHSIATFGADLFTTHSPCRSCCKLIIRARIQKVFFRTEFRDTRGIQRLMDADIIVSQLKLEDLE